MEPEEEPVDSVAAVAAGVAAGAQQIDECMADIGDLMADMFGAVAVAIDGQAQGGPRAVVAARRRQRELDEQAQRDREQALASADAATPRAVKDVSPLVGSATEEGCGGAVKRSTLPRVPSSPSDRVRPGTAGSGCAAQHAMRSSALFSYEDPCFSETCLFATFIAVLGSCRQAVEAAHCLPGAPRGLRSRRQCHLVWTRGRGCANERRVARRR